MNFAPIFAQKDSIYLTAKVANNLTDVAVQQEITYHNPLRIPLQKIKLLNWIAAYKNKKTSLADRKLEDRKNDLYFAKKQELGKISNLQITIGAQNFETNPDQENLFLSLEKPLQPGEKISIKLQYQLQLPSQKFTGYGAAKNQATLKYFFVVPDNFETNEQVEKFYSDTEETENGGTFWDVNLQIPTNFFSKSNLPKMQADHYQGMLVQDPEFLIADADFPSIETTIDGTKYLIDFGYAISPQEISALEFYAPLHLKFIKAKLGFLPSKIYISEKLKQHEDFFGNDDIQFWKFKYQLFTDPEKVDLDYYSIFSKKIAENTAIINKNTEHWYQNGLKTYLEIQYLKQFYKDTKILGALVDNAKIFGMKPLKLFNASKIGLLSRYGIAYQYIVSQNLDQPIAEDFPKLNNFNEMAISNFETGNLFQFLAEKMGIQNFEQFLKDFIKNNSDKKLDTSAFFASLSEVSGHSSDFLPAFLQHKNRVNFNLKKFKKSGENLLVTITKNTELPIPVKLETIAKTGDRKTYWLDTKSEQKIIEFSVPNTDVHKLVINDQYAFPESNFGNNYLYTTGIFANAKKIKFKLFKDIPNNEYREIYLNPRLNFNVYDKILLGLNFKNTSLLDQAFSYSITPYYSSGTRSLAGSGAIEYSFMPAKNFFRRLNFGISGSFFHYDYDLAYRKFSVSSSIEFTKNPRSTIGRSFGASYNFYERDLSPQMNPATEYDKYHLWSVGYGYSDSKLINEYYLGGNLQGMEDFTKISGEAFYRWEFAQNRKMSFRFFGGYFLNNTTKNSMFNYGVSNVSNYSFSYGFLGQSAKSGILSQQFIMGDGGFKSLFGGSVNQWMTAVNMDTQIWKIFGIYADAGVVKNRLHQPQFLYDSGLKIKVIPDFFEIYLPVQSNLGFEPGFKDYGYRIRYTIILNLNAAIGYFRRGWF